MVLLRLPEVLSTDRLLIQRLRYEDAEEIFHAYASKPEATRYVSWPTHVSLSDTRAFLQYAVRAWKQGIDCSYSLRLRHNNRLVGSLGVMNENGRVQFGYILSPTQWGQGLATEACRAVLPLVQAQPGVYRVGTFVDADNVASSRVLEKCGLVAEAKLSGWFYFVNQQAVKDCILYRLL